MNETKLQHNYLPSSYSLISHGHDTHHLETSLRNSTIGLKQSGGYPGQFIILTVNKDDQTFAVAAAKLKTRDDKITYNGENYYCSWHIELLSIVKPFPLEPIALRYLSKKALGMHKRSMRVKIQHPELVQQLNKVFFSKYL